MILQTLLYIVFALSSIVLITVILLQEGKGGGFGDALGTAGQQAFGVQTKGIQTFTGIVAGVFMLSAVAIHITVRQTSQRSVVEDAGGTGIAAPAEPGAAGGADSHEGHDHE
jgi:protein translocase SecG subunit